MTGWPLYLFGIVLAALAVWRAPRPRLKFLFILWLVGLFLSRLAPAFTAMILISRGAPERAHTAAVLAIGWSGSLVLLYTLLALTFWDRPFRRRTWLAFIGLSLALLFGYSKGVRPTAAILLSIPWLWSARWSLAMSGGRLTAVSFGALLSFFLFTFSFGPARIDPVLASSLPGLSQFQLVVQAMVALYSLMAVPRTAWRIQFSIRRISWRLVVSHLLAGLIPGVLAIAFLLLAGALYLSTYRGAVAERSLRRASNTAETRIVEALQAGSGVPSAPFGSDFLGQIVVDRDDGGPARVRGDTLACDPESLLAAPFAPREALLLWDGNRLFLRARVDTVVANRRLIVEALAPIDSLRMARISDIIGVPVRINPLVRVVRTEAGISLNDNESVTEGTAIGPRRPGGLHLPGGAIVPCLFSTGDGWRKMVIPVTSSASLGEMLTSLVTTSRENPLATVVLIILAILAFLFLGAIWVTTGMVVGMGRSIAKTVRALTDATRALREGKLEHRIRLEGQDELWSVAGSFNEMAEGLERMRAIELERERLEQELRLARDIQTRLLPPGPPSLEGLDLAGLSVPARHVGGDYFDYLALDGKAIGLVVADVSGKGVPAALLMSSFRAALRSEDLAALGPARVMSRVNRFVCASVDPGKFITAFLGVLDARTGTFRYASAGHDPPVLLARDGALRELSEGGLLLGIFPEAEYEDTAVQMEPGTTLAVFTDGVTDAQSPAEEFFGRERLIASLGGGARGETCAGLLERVVAEIQHFEGVAPQYDDITLVLARRT